MSGRAVVAVAVALLAVPALPADKAQRKDGDSSSGSSRSGASERQPSSSSSKPSSYKSSPSSTRSGGSASRKTGESSSVGQRSRASRPPTTGAQRRHPRPGTGSGSVDLPYYGGSYGGYRKNYYRGNPYYFSPFYRPGYGSIYGYGPYRYGYGFGPYSSYGYSPYPYSGSSYSIPFGGGASEEEEEQEIDGSGSLRLVVQPEKTRVFVNGNYAGLVDDYDGILQRLRLPAGRQEVTLRLDGYRTQHFNVDVVDGDTVKIEHKMVRGVGEATSDQYAGQYAGRPVGHARFEEEQAQRYEAPVGLGSVRFEVRPLDASVYVNGEFLGTGSALSTLELPPGRHRIEVVRPGYRTVERDVDVAPGETTPIEVDLDRN